MQLRRQVEEHRTGEIGALGEIRRWVEKSQDDFRRVILCIWNENIVRVLIYSPKQTVIVRANYIDAYH